MEIQNISTGNTYSGTQLLAYAARHPSALIFLENASCGIRANDGTMYDVVAVEHGFLQMQGGANKSGEIMTIRPSY